MILKLFSGGFDTQKVSCAQARAEGRFKGGVSSRVMEIRLDGRIPNNYICLGPVGATQLSQMKKKWHLKGDQNGQSESWVALSNLLLAQHLKFLAPQLMRSPGLVE